MARRKTGQLGCPVSYVTPSNGNEYQKMSISKPMTTSRPMRKMIPAVLARNLSM
ncbi:MAG: hypothetical protein ACRC3F_13650 [Billgrantia desiderata]